VTLYPFTLWTEQPGRTAAVGPAVPAKSEGESLRDPQPGQGVTVLLPASAESEPATDNVIPAETARFAEADIALSAGTAGPTDSPL
jgi:hypothetical protein